MAKSHLVTRVLFAMMLGASLVLGAAVGGGSALALTATGKAAATTQLEPSPQITGVTPLAWVPAGTTVTLQCLATGQSVSGKLASNDPYYFKVTYNGQTGYVSDSDMLTSANAPSLGLSSCIGGPTTPPPPTSGRYNAAIVSNARAVPIGSTANNGNNCALWAEYIIRKAGGPSIALGASDGSGYNDHWAMYATKVGSLSQAQPGDIIQWYRAGHVQHSAILISGNTVTGAVVKSGGYYFSNGAVAVNQYNFSVDYNSFGGAYYTIWRIN